MEIRSGSYTCMYHNKVEMNREKMLSLKTYKMLTMEYDVQKVDSFLDS